MTRWPSLEVWTVGGRSISYDSSFYRRQGAGGALTLTLTVDSKPYVNRMGRRGAFKCVSVECRGGEE